MQWVEALREDNRGQERHGLSYMQEEEHLPGEREGVEERQRGEKVYGRNNIYV